MIRKLKSGQYRLYSRSPDAEQANVETSEPLIREKLQ